MSDTLTIKQSLMALEIARMFSERNQNECAFIEPDDTLDLYFDFMEKINPYDYINDWRLDELLQKVFCRKKKEMID